MCISLRVTSCTVKTHSDSESQQVTSVQACEILRKDRATVTRWVTSGRLVPTFKFPGRTGGYLFDRADVEALAAEASE